MRVSMQFYAHIAEHGMKSLAGLNEGFVAESIMTKRAILTSRD